MRINVWNRKVDEKFTRVHNQSSRWETVFADFEQIHSSLFTLNGSEWLWIIYDWLPIPECESKLEYMYNAGSQVENEMDSFDCEKNDGEKEY